MQNLRQSKVEDKTEAIRQSKVDSKTESKAELRQNLRQNLRQSKEKCKAVLDRKLKRSSVNGNLSVFDYTIIQLDREVDFEGSVKIGQRDHQKGDEVFTIASTHGLPKKIINNARIFSMYELEGAAVDAANFS